MAGCIMRKSKDGISYRIRVSCGYDSNGKQIIRSMEWRPKPHWKPETIERQLAKVKAEFELKCKQDSTSTAPVKFAELAQMFIEDAMKRLRPQSVHRLEACIERTNQALGHLRVDKIDVRKVQKFIDNLQEPGVSKAHDSARPRPALRELLQGRTQKSLAEQTGISRSRISEIMRGDKTSYRTAEKLASALDKPISDLFVITKSDRILSPKTERHYLSYVSDVLEYGIRVGMVASNPCRKVTLRPLDEEEKQIFTLDEAQHFVDSLDNAPVKYRAFFTLALLGGLRRGELLGLRWSDVDFERHAISIRQSSQYLPGVGQFIDDLKTKSSHRTLRLQARVFTALRQLRAEQNEERLKLGDRWSNEGNLIFTGTDGKPLSPNTPYNWLKRFCQDTGQRFIGIHGFRHTNASLLIVEADADPVLVSKSLGHSSTTVTLNTYAHSFQSAQARKADELGSLFPERTERNA